MKNWNYEEVDNVAIKKFAQKIENCKARLLRSQVVENFGSKEVRGLHDALHETASGAQQATMYNMINKFEQWCNTVEVKDMR